MQEKLLPKTFKNRPIWPHWLEIALIGFLLGRRMPGRRITPWDEHKQNELWGVVVVDSATVLSLWNLWGAEWSHTWLWSSLGLGDDKLLLAPKHNIYAFFAILICLFDTFICLSNLSFELWNRKFKMNEFFEKSWWDFKIWPTSINLFLFISIFCPISHSNVALKWRIL